MEMAHREAEWARQGAARAELEQRLTAYALEEAITTFATEHPEVTDAVAIAALQAVQDAAEREVMSGIPHEPNGDGLVRELAQRIWRNAHTMRQRVGIPHNVLLARVARLLVQRAALLTRRTADGRGYLRAARIDTPPHSLETLLQRLTTRVEATGKGA
jgi:hypothetical protein